MGNRKNNTPAVKATVGVKTENAASAVTNDPNGTEAGIAPAVTNDTNGSEAGIASAVTNDPNSSEAGIAPAVTNDPNDSEAGIAPAVTNDLIADEPVIIPSGKFISENGNEYNFTVDKFTFKGENYTKEKALSDHHDVLEHLVSVNSFILKRI